MDDEPNSQLNENYCWNLKKNIEKNMSSIKIIDLQPEREVEELKPSEADLKAVSGGIQFDRLSNNIVDVTFGGFRLRI
ncbi:hypothetical protein A6770_34540 [Nostoc minutum NIES-26]|uniref:Uncharacterized protein n=1 Tax=Nostoc minutum NIES-26 TaxID=1844469 RepID=A0A367S0Z2_9NOSO|nr:hypothetical protein A6770_34540 [Nostoc minutum NIES-26]